MLALVPARGGSKRIPGKNVRPLAGVPLLLWTLIPFRHLHPVVSSEDAEILSLARRHGFDVIERPVELASDTATSAAVALHAMAQTGDKTVLLLQPTSPFRHLDTVDLALWVYETKGLPVVATRDLPHVYIGANKVAGQCHAPVGTCFVIGHEALERHQTFLPPGFVSVPEVSMAAIDIDTEDDWQHAEAIAASRVSSLHSMGCAA